MSSWKSGASLRRFTWPNAFRKFSARARRRAFRAGRKMPTTRPPRSSRCFVVRRPATASPGHPRPGLADRQKLKQSLPCGLHARPKPEIARWGSEVGGESLLIFSRLCNTQPGKGVSLKRRGTLRCVDVCKTMVCDMRLFFVCTAEPWATKCIRPSGCFFSPFRPLPCSCSGKHGSCLKRFLRKRRT